MSLVHYKTPPENCDWSVEFVVIEFWSAALDPGSFKCVVATTYHESVAEDLVKENRLYRTWVKAYRIYSKD